MNIDEQNRKNKIESLWTPKRLTIAPTIVNPFLLLMKDYGSKTQVHVRTVQDLRCNSHEK
ncbi:hypothetical protein BpHYR1_026555 [Brachionus plicatilis]|uniref:Uncharacterized protein n=1 Tax=Brachionus plicatilis TaxID=10195 RepID=A0A3M7SC95_BRAPC|nr:hypothetical protein BpHYR1_026555 [Brachionus plicatilis]